MPKASDLDEAIRAVCPSIHGVSVGSWDDRATWRVDFAEAATAQQRAAAADVVRTFDPIAPPRPPAKGGASIEERVAALEAQVAAIMHGKPVP